MDAYDQALGALPPWLAQPLSRVPKPVAAQIHEIRLRRDSPVLLTRQGRQTEASAYCPVPQPTAAQMEEILFSLCGGSLHAVEEQLRQGYFTLAGGHRVGVGGRYVTNGQGVPVLQRVESLNLRIARFCQCPLPPQLLAVLQGRFVGLLIVGEPDSGKTTLLRSILPVLAARRRTAVVIDERGEILPEAAVLPGGGWCDRIAGLDKPQAIQMALRALGPQVMLVDELGTLAETRLLRQGFFGGVDLVATLHAATLAEAEQRPQCRYLLRQGMLHYACCLAGRTQPGSIREVKRYC